MDADEKYVYFLLSRDSGQPNNIIIALDWNSENLLPIVNGEKEYIKEMWSCNNKGTGKPDAVITVKTPYEVEALYHTTDKSGKEHFYMAEHHGRGKYKTVTVTRAYKVKWKKVKKKVKVKGKVKIKKVWKYKTKYKKVRVTKKVCTLRDGYVYDLGVI
jgi:hypothetical protein